MLHLINKYKFAIIAASVILVGAFDGPAAATLDVGAVTTEQAYNAGYVSTAAMACKYELKSVASDAIDAITVKAREAADLDAAYFAGMDDFLASKPCVGVVIKFGDLFK